MSSHVSIGFRRRLYILPPFIWANLSKSGISWSFHLGIATWNTRTGWYFHGPLGIWMRYRGWTPQHPYHPRKAS